MAAGPTSTLLFAAPNSGLFWLDDLSATAAAPVPETPSIVLLGLLFLLGLGGIAVCHKHKAGAARGYQRHEKSPGLPHL